MKAKKIIRKIVMLCAWMLTGAGLVTLLVAANRRETGKICASVQVSIRGAGEQFFVDKSDIMHQLVVAAGQPLVNRPVASIRLSALEKALEKGVWIKDAELYIDARHILHVQVVEREPIGRVFTRLGASFYIDSTGHRLPLLQKETARVLVISNYPDAKNPRGNDSVAAAGALAYAKALHAQPFWKEQLAQIDITASGTFEALPVVGNHIVRLGNATAIGEKLERLLLFYQQVLRHTGFDKYDVVDVQYKGQVVGVHRGTTGIVDSVQLKKNIEDLLENSRLRMLEDSLAQVQKIFDADSLGKIQLLPAADTSTIRKPSPDPDPTKTNTSKPERKTSAVATPLPKAVMRARAQ